MDPTIRRQMIRFAVSGVLATASDALLYTVLLRTVLSGLFDVAKGISFLTGTMLAFLLNKFWTFGARGQGMQQAARFFVLYGVTLGVNVATNRLVIEIGQAAALPNAHVLPPAFVIATGMSTIANFLGQKLWVFRTVAAPTHPVPPP